MLGTKSEIMAKKKIPKYSNLPPYIYLQPNNRYQDTRTGKYLSPQQLTFYTSPKEVITKENKQQEHWINKYYGN